MFGIQRWQWGVVIIVSLVVGLITSIGIVATNTDLFGVPDEYVLFVNTGIIFVLLTVTVYLVNRYQQRKL